MIAPGRSGCPAGCRSCLAITGANTALSHTLGRSPTVACIAAYLDISEEEVLEGLEGARAYTATSLPTPISADANTELGETLGGEDHECELAETRLDLAPAMAAPWTSASRKSSACGSTAT